MKTSDLVISMSQERIQEDVIVNCGRRLTNKEFEDMRERIDSHISNFILDEAYKVINFNRLKRRMKDAENRYCHFLVYFRNANLFQDSFIKRGAFKHRNDAKQFIDYQEAEEFDQWKITQVRNGVETDLVEEINEF